MSFGQAIRLHLTLSLCSNASVSGGCAPPPYSYLTGLTGDVNDLPPASKQTDGGVFMPIWEKIFEGDIDIDTLTPENVFGKCIKRVPASDAENALDERDVGGRCKGKMHSSIE